MTWVVITVYFYQQHFANITISSLKGTVLLRMFPVIQWEIKYYDRFHFYLNICIEFPTFYNIKKSGRSFCSGIETPVFTPSVYWLPVYLKQMCYSLSKRKYSKSCCKLIKYAWYSHFRSSQKIHPLINDKFIFPNFMVAVCKQTPTFACHALLIQYSAVFIKNLCYFMCILCMKMNAIRGDLFTIMR